MKTICGWCKKLMRGDENSTVISHGICAECAEKMRKELLGASKEFSEDVRDPNNFSAFIG